jgi:CubicO group peptidase (beta-lactamase class C family)
MKQDLVRAVLETAVASGAVAGVVAAVTDRSGTILEVAAGRQSADAPEPMQVDSVFWVASMTKALTTVAALQMVEEGRLTLNDPIGKILPDLANPVVLEGFAPDGSPMTRPTEKKITLGRLLTHTAGFSYDFASADLARYLKVTESPSAATGLKAGLRQPLLFEPGARWEYSIGVDWAGLAVEAVSGRRLDDYFAGHVTGPLGMNDTVFNPGKARAARRVAMHTRTPEGGLAVAPWEPRPAPEFLSGGGGLYSTAPDYLAFMRMILNEGGEILLPETVEAMSTNQIGKLRAGRIGSADPAVIAASDFYPGMDAKWGLGFLLNPEPGPFGRSANSLTWAGLPNCYYWIDPAKGIAAVILMQLLPSGDPGALRAYAGFEAAVYASL